MEILSLADLLDVQDVSGLVLHRCVCSPSVAHEAPHAIRLQAGGVIRAFPGSVLGIVSFDNARTQGQRRDVRSDAQVMARKADSSYVSAEFFFQTGYFIEADFLERNWVA